MYTSLVLAVFLTVLSCMQYRLQKLKSSRYVFLILTICFAVLALIRLLAVINPRFDI